MKLDDPGSAGGSADSTAVGDTVDETGRKQSGRDLPPVPDSARNHPMSRDAMFAGASKGLESAAEAPSVPSGDASSGPGPADSSVHGDAAADTVDGDASGEQGGAGQGGIARGTESAGSYVHEAVGDASDTSGGPPREPLDGGDQHREEPLLTGYDPVPAPRGDLVPGQQEQERQAPAVTDDAGHSGLVREHGLAMPDNVQRPAEDSARDEQDAEDSDRRSRPDAAEAPRRIEGAAVRVSASRDGDVQEQSVENQSEGREQVAEPIRERPRTQEHEPEVRPEAGVEQTDEQRWAAMEQRMQSAMEQKLEAVLEGFKADYEAKLDEIKADHKAEIDARRAETDEIKARNDVLEAKLAEEQAKVSELKDRLDAVERPLEDKEGSEPPGTSDVARLGEREGEPDTGNDAEAAALKMDKADIAGRVGEAARPEASADERPESDPDASRQQLLGVAGAAGIVNPVLQVALAADSTRRNYSDLSPDDKYNTNNLMDSFVTASSSLPPGAAVLAVTAAATIPALRGGLKGAIDKLKRRE